MKKRGSIRAPMFGMKILFLICFIGLNLCVIFNLYSSEKSSASEKPITVEFRLVCSEAVDNCERIIFGRSNEELYIHKDVLISLDDITFAEEWTNPTDTYLPMTPRESLKITSLRSTPTLRFEFVDGIKDKLKSITSENVNKRLGFFVDGKLLGAPIITEPILTAELEIVVDISSNEVKTIVNRINEAIGVEARARTDNFPLE